MDNMHPLMIQALQNFAPPPESDAMQQYRKALREFDWRFEFSDDGESHRQGSAALKELHAMQQALDPDGSIWRAMQPGRWGEPMPIVRDVK